MISQQSKDLLTSKGLLISGDKENNLSIIKPKGIPGNYLPENNMFKIPISWGNKQISTDCPIVRINKEGKKFSVISWEWTPGPGPGDFFIDLNSEEEAIDFIVQYYFYDNEYFNARKNYLIQNRNSINISDIQHILEKLCKQLEDKVSDSEIIFFDRGTFNKIPISKWRITEFQEERTKIETETRFIRDEVGRLRKKITDKSDFNQEDLLSIADLITELSFLVKN